MGETLLALKATGMNWIGVYNVLYRTSKRATDDTLIRLAATLNVSVSYLIDESSRHS